MELNIKSLHKDAKAEIGLASSVHQAFTKQEELQASKEYDADHQEPYHEEAEELEAATGGVTVDPNEGKPVNASWEDYKAKVLADENAELQANPPVYKVRTAMNPSLIMMSDDNPGVRTTIVGSGFDGIVTQIIEEADVETKYEMLKVDLLPPTVKAFYLRLTHVVAGINESSVTVTDEEGSTVAAR